MRYTADPGSELAKLRMECHRTFDALWAFGQKSRNDAYRDLARRMNVPDAECHFGMFNEEQCREALKILRGE